MRSILSPISRITAILSLLAITMLGVSSASAATRYWTVNISEPDNTIKTSSFVLDFQVFSTEVGDTFTVEALNYGNPTGLVQNVTSTGKGGDSGRFSLNNVPNGTYSYSVKATNTTAGEEKISSSSTFTVAVAAPTVVTINNAGSSSGANFANAGGSSGSTTASTASASTTGSSVASTDGSSSDESVASAQGSSEGDSVTETSSETAGTDVQGEQDESSSNAGRNVAITLLVIAAIGAAGWFIFSRLNRSEVS